MICSKCGHNFPDVKRSNRSKNCPDCIRKYQKEYRKNHLEHITKCKKIYRQYTKNKTKKHNNTYHQKIKYECMAQYCPNRLVQCKQCGFNDMRALCIDHIDGGGTQHRKSLGGGGSVFYKWLKKNNYPAGFQVLCTNCNFIKRFENNESRKGVI